MLAETFLPHLHFIECFQVLFKESLPVGWMHFGTVSRQDMKYMAVLFRIQGKHLNFDMDLKIGLYNKCLL